MRPLMLHMKDFMSYYNVVLDLHAMSLGTIVGNNGAGKSTILQAITYCLWGQVRTGSHNDIVRRGREGCAVRLDFKVRDQEYSVTRRRDLSGKGSSDLEFTMDGKPLTGHTIKQTQEEIDRVLGMSYDLFASSSLLQQGDASRFSDARPGERKELLAEMLSLGWFQELEKRARQKLKEIEASLESMSAVGVSVRQSMTEAMSGHVDVDFLNAKRNVCRNELTSVKANLEKLRVDLSDLRVEQNNLDMAEARKAGYLTRIVELETTIQKLEDEAKSLDVWREQHDEILSAREELQEKAARKKGLDAVAHLKETADQLDELMERLVEEEESCDVFFTELESIKEAVAEMDDNIEAMKQELDAVRAERSTAQSRLRVSESIYEQTRDSRERLANTSTCPTCLQKIENHDTLLADFDAAMEKTEKDIWNFRTAISELDAKDREMREDLDKAEAIRRDDIRLKTRLETDVVRSELKISSTKAEIAQADIAKGKLQEANFDPDEYAELVGDVERLPEIESLYAQMMAGMARLGAIGPDLQEARTSLGKGNIMLTDLGREIDALEEEIGTFEPEEWLVEEIANLDGELERRQGELSAIEAQIATQKERSRQLAEMGKQLKELESKVGQAEEEKRIASLLVKATSKTGAQALLIEAALPQIEKDANAYLEEISPGMKLLLNAQRETLRGSATETLDIVVSADGQEAPIETLSGGERFRADLSLRLAIGKMLSRRSGTKVEMLAIDEGFGSQDATGQAAVVDAIASLTPIFDLVLVISHVRSVADALGSIGSTIEVEKIGGKSVVRIE